MNIEKILTIIIVVSFIISTIALTWVFMFFPQETKYEYTVKTQQAFDSSRVNESDVTHFDNLSDDEQDVLHQAFKKSDHFLGNSKVIVQTNEQMDVLNGWRSVEVNGVILVVSVSEESYQSIDGGERLVGIGIFSAMICYSLVITRTVTP